MKVVVLAGGKSNRIKPVEDKNFLKFCGKYLLEWQLDRIAKAGFDDFVIVAGGHNVERIEEFANDYAKRTAVVVQQGHGMDRALVAARDEIGEEDFLVVSSNDVVESSAFELMMTAVQDKSYEGFLLAKVVKEYFPGGYLSLGHDHRIEHIVEKPGAGNEPSNMVNVVVHYHRNAERLFEYIEKAESKNDDVYEVALAAMMKDDIAFKAVEYEGHWQAVKYPWHVIEVADYFFEDMEKNISDEAQIAKTAVINGDVIIEAGVKIFDGAVINGPVYIGEDTVIATNALVRGSYLGANCVIGYATEVARSFLGDQVWTHSNYVGDSVIGNNCSFGAGTVIGNLRLDEKNISVNCGDQKVDSGSNKFGIVMGDNVRCGINTSFMPGVKIGSDSMIGAGIVVAEDVEERMFVRGEWKLKKSENKAVLDEKARDEMRGKMGS